MHPTLAPLRNRENRPRQATPVAPSGPDIRAAQVSTDVADTRVSTSDERMNVVKNALTSGIESRKAPKRVENKEFAGFQRRIIKAHAKRVAEGDVEALTDLVALSEHIDDAITDAVKGLRAFGYSWSEIARPLGMTKQAAQQRWGGDRP